ncbi:hypothetical protein [Streptomyces sp. NPDC051364]|uniref:hypothetical protein n=1 Tax=Streptomyces sp. NPDC051364 TaxID=3155799 RepID=UPI00342AF85A
MSSAPNRPEPQESIEVSSESVLEGQGIDPCPVLVRYPGHGRHGAGAPSPQGVAFADQPRNGLPEDPRDGEMGSDCGIGVGLRVDAPAAVGAADADVDPPGGPRCLNGRCDRRPLSLPAFSEPASDAPVPAMVAG